MELLQIYEYMLYAYQIIVIALILASCKNTLLKTLYGAHRYKKIVFLDIGQTVWKKINKYHTFKVFKTEYVHVPANEIYGYNYFHSDQSEQLKVEWNKDKMEYYIDSHEFTISFHNKVFDRMMISKESTVLSIIMILVIVQVAMMLYFMIKFNSISANIAYFSDLIKRLQETGVIKI